MALIFIDEIWSHKIFDTRKKSYPSHLKNIFLLLCMLCLDSAFFFLKPLGSELCYFNFYYSLLINKGFMSNELLIIDSGNSLHTRRRYLKLTVIKGVIDRSKDLLEFILDDIGEKITLDGQIDSSGYLLWLTNGEKRKERKEKRKLKQKQNKTIKTKQNKTTRISRFSAYALAIFTEYTCFVPYIGNKVRYMFIYWWICTISQSNECKS